MQWAGAVSIMEGRELGFHWLILLLLVVRNVHSLGGRMSSPFTKVNAKCRASSEGDVFRTPNPLSRSIPFPAGARSSITVAAIIHKWGLD